MKKYFILFLLCICISVCFISLLQKEKKVKEYNSLENVELAIYLNDKETNSIPSKDSGYYYDREKSTCSNGSYINWDSVSWSPVVNNMSEYKTRCELHFTTTYTEGILNGADPVLKDELVPITIENNGTVKKADLESEWYSYANKNWANAVILKTNRNETTLYDLSGNDNHATLIDGTLTDEGILFDGVDDYAKVSELNWNNTTEFTIEFTAQIFEASNSVMLFESSNDSNTNVGSFYLDTHEYGTNEIQVAIKNSADINNPIVNHKQSNNIINSNNFETYTVTFNSKNSYNNFIHIYKNGVEQSIEVPSVDSEYPLDQDITGMVLKNYAFYIGARNGEETFAKMALKNLKIYTKELNADEVKNNYTGNISKENLILWYNLEDINKTKIIPEEVIESYFVWIPKYRYQLWDLGLYDSLTAIDESKAHEIPIIFGDYNTSDNVAGECTTPMESGATGNCQVGDYMTHPAFLSIPSTGFWVGKFETGYVGARSTVEAQQNVNDSSKVIIKPNVYSWRGIQVANAFYTSYNYKRDLDSHMMKNTEWGAVAYLQHSAYGGATRVRINNNSNFITGYQANEEPTCGWTGTNEECNRYCNDGTCNIAYPESILASTTDNVTGIFDMSGGTREYVMGVMVDEQDNPMSGRSNLYNSGFIGGLGCPQCDAGTDGSTYLATGYSWPDVKYYDVYFFFKCIL